MALQEPSKIADLFPLSVDIQDEPAAWRRSVPTCPGICLLTDEQDKIIQLFSSASLRRRLTTKLTPQPSDSAKKVDLSAIVRRSHMRQTASPFETNYWYWRAARQLYPKRYRKMVVFGKVWFVQVETDSDIPQWKVVDDPFTQSGISIGPMQTRKSAAELIGELEDIFDLCRYYHVLRKAPHGEACSYFQMGKCPAPCDGTVSMQSYRTTVATSAAWLQGQQVFTADLERQMHRFARNMQFEQAAALKKKLERAQAMHSAFDGNLRPVEQFRLLIAQPGPKKRQVQLFAQQGGQLTDLGATNLVGLNRRICRLIDHWDSFGSSESPSVDAIALTCYHRHRSSREPGLYVMIDENVNASTVADAVAARFDVVDETSDKSPEKSALFEESSSE